MRVLRSAVVDVTLATPTAASVPARAADPAFYVYVVLGKATDGTTAAAAHAVLQPEHGCEYQARQLVTVASRLLRAGAGCARRCRVDLRGNHELCSRAGPGFLYFLDPGSKLLGSGASQHACPDQDGASQLAAVVSSAGTVMPT